MKSTDPTFRYRPDIDGLRALAVLLVVGYHAFPGIVPGGFIGVDVFFVISGFLITGIIVHEARAGSFTFLDFYLRRCRRIIPALATVLAATWLIGWATLTAPEYENLGAHLLGGATFTSNLLLWHEAGYFDAPAELKPLLHLWSLGVEEQFYLLWPVLLIVILRRATLLPAALCALLIASFAANVLGIDRYPAAAFYLLPTRFWELLAGGALACLGIAGSAAKDHAPNAATSGIQLWMSGKVLPDALAASGLVLIVGAAYFIDRTAPYPGWLALAPVAGTALLISAGSSAWVNRRILSKQVAVFIGLISYPLYLWHWPLLSIYRIIDQQGGVPLAMSRAVRVTLVTLSFALAYATWRFIEKPTQRLVSRLSSERTTLPRLVVRFAFVLIAVAGLGFATLERDGLQFRHASLSQRQTDIWREISPSEFALALARYPACLGDFHPARKQRPYCFQGSGRHPDIAILGDSHSRSLFPGLAAALAATGSTVIEMGAPDCPLLHGVTVRSGNTMTDCREGNDLVMNLIATSPTIRTVVLASRGPLYFSGGFNAVDRHRLALVSADGFDPDAPSQASLFRRGVSETIRLLEQSGKTVVFVVDIPELGFSIHECVYARPYQGSNAALRAPCAVSRSVVHERQSEYRRIVSELSIEHPKLRVFDPTSLLCDGDFCYGMRDGHALYFDDDHLGLYGTGLVGEALADFLHMPDRLASQ